MKVLITGFPGMGKSAIASELKRRGHVAYDPQAMRGYEYVVDRETGRHIHPPEPVPRGWFDQVGAQAWDPVKMRRLLERDGDIFICAFVHNLPEFYELFDHMFVLTLDDVELEQRLLGRPGSRIGKHPEELADIMALHRDFERAITARGAIVLNARHGVHELVSIILATVQAPV